VIDGTASRSSLQDIREIFLADAEREMGLRPALGLDGRGILTQTCSQCHNGRLDQGVSRANFNVLALDQMSRAVKDKAIARLSQEAESTKIMPPRRFARLSAEEIALAVEELKK
jgi:hypothetical protein